MAGMNKTVWIVGVGAIIGLPLVVVAYEAPLLRAEVELLAPVNEQTGLLSTLRGWLGIRQPSIIRPAPGTKLVVNSSAYASSPYQTDDTPCITAAGTRVRPGVVATNFLPMGTLLSINGELFIVEDRMNPRYVGKFMDIWFENTEEALNFGRQKLQIEVVGYGTPGQELSRAQDSEIVPGSPSILKRASLRFTAFIRLLSNSLSAKVGPDVNRHDVDCLAEAEVGE